MEPSDVRDTSDSADLHYLLLCLGFFCSIRWHGDVILARAIASVKTMFVFNCDFDLFE